MLSAERLEWILERIEEEGTVEVKTLSEALEVSVVTIRRDLDKLTNLGKVFRTHGGASLWRPSTQEERYTEKAIANHESKTDIAKEAVSLLQNGMSIILDAGTTTMEVARQIVAKRMKGVRVLTNDLVIAYYLFTIPDVEVIMIGGNVTRDVGSTEGMFATDLLKQVHCDRAFIGTSGMSLDYLLYTPTEEKVALKRQMMASADQSVLLLDKSKLGRSGLYRFADVDQFDVLVSDIKWSDGDRQGFKKKGVHVMSTKGGME